MNAHDHILELAHDLRINCVTKEMIRERLMEIDNLDSLSKAAQGMIEELRPKMAYAGVREEMLDVTIELVGRTMDLEFLVEEGKKFRTGGSNK